MHKFQNGDRAYLTESNRWVRMGTVFRIQGDRCIFQFSEGGAICVSLRRVYATREAAESAVRKPEPPKKPEVKVIGHEGNLAIFGPA